MKNSYREFRTTVGGRELVVETGKYAEQTNGSCVVRCGETAPDRLKTRHVQLRSCT